MFYIVNVEGAVYRDGRYLMIVEDEGSGGELAFSGGKVEVEAHADDVMETELRRELMEEVGVRVGELMYVKSSHFVTNVGEKVVDVIFLCQHAEGEGRPVAKDEVDAVYWLTVDEILAHPACQPWTKDGIKRADALRARLGW